MNSESITLQKALDVLRRHYGERLSGPQGGGEAQMRETLQQELGLDASSSERIIRDLSDTDKLVYINSTDPGSEVGTNTTGPVISMPLTQTSEGGAPLVTTASPAMIMGIVDYQGGDVSEVVDSEGERPPEPIAPQEDEEVEGDRLQGYWRIG